jgi:hypothetical protein
MVTDNTDGSQTFRIYCPHAETVAIVGGFTPEGSAGVSMERTGDGWWEATMRIAPGDHTFRYVVNGQGSIPDYAAGGLARDDSGSWVSCLHVAEPAHGVGPEAVRGAGARAATITDVQVRQLLSGRRVVLEVEGAEPVALSLAPARGGAARALPRPDWPHERRRDGAREGRPVERRGERSRLG